MCLAEASGDTVDVLLSAWERLDACIEVHGRPRDAIAVTKLRPVEEMRVVVAEAIAARKGGSDA
jgi:hypothetical protein